VVAGIRVRSGMPGDFLDSNVLIYAFERSDLRKRAIAEALIRTALRSDGAVSFQVVQETLNVLLRRAPRTVGDRELEALLDDVLAPLWSVGPSPVLYRRGVRLHARYGLTFYDSLIVAAALEAGCRRLLTEDLQHGQVIEGLRVENPFA
jgi:predicted nucleic acid-binding protein